MKALIFFFVLISAAVAQNPNCTPDAAVASKRCYLTFLQNFGFSDIPAYDDFLSVWTNMKHTQGLQAMQSLCTWFQTLDSCLLPVIGGCNSTDGYQKILGVDATNAETYFMFYAAERFECNEGYHFLMNNYYCLLSVEIYHPAELQQCEDNFSQATEKKPFNCS